jgi:hypothetical protein
MEEAERKQEVIELILDLGKYDNEHILLDSHELALTRLIAAIGDFSKNIFNTNKTMGEDNTIVLTFSSIKSSLIDIYVNLVLVTSHKSDLGDLQLIKSTHITDNVEFSFDISILNILMNSVGALTEGITFENKLLFNAAIKLILKLIKSILNIYKIDFVTFLNDVEDAVFDMLIIKDAEYIDIPSNKLQTQFKGKKSISMNVKVDKRKKSPFVGFNVILDNKNTLFKNTSPYRAFLEAVQYVNEETEFKDVKFLMDIKTKTFINNYSIMFIKENILVENMERGFYPILTPKGVTDIEGFLEALTK